MKLLLNLALLTFTIASGQTSETGPFSSADTATIRNLQTQALEQECLQSESSYPPLRKRHKRHPSEAIFLTSEVFYPDHSNEENIGNPGYASQAHHYTSSLRTITKTCFKVTFGSVAIVLGGAAGGIAGLAATPVMSAKYALFGSNLYLIDGTNRNNSCKYLLALLVSAPFISAYKAGVYCYSWVDGAVEFTDQLIALL
ncbi:hypothetical protein [Candidatus Odyssella thessalonicensis]|uniref:hypothetical protein n=1 Tax=Candidatus Odyssella thessalonicensis TaxID=84647 RepID=UPI000225BB09|nr:hypothetical protein [Candidatus Odyssella thessalonicensis]